MCFILVLRWRWVIRFIPRTLYSGKISPIPQELGVIGYLELTRTRWLLSGIEK